MGIHRSPVDFPHKGQWCEAYLLFSLICLNKRLSKQSIRRRFERASRSLWRYCNVLKRRTGCTANLMTRTVHTHTELQNNYVESIDDILNWEVLDSFFLYWDMFIQIQLIQVIKSYLTQMLNIFGFTSIVNLARIWRQTRCLLYKQQYTTRTISVSDGI